MAAINFDTLKATGIPEEHAKAVAEAFREPKPEADLATRRDLDEMEGVLRRDLRELEYRLTIKLGGIIIVAVGAVATLVKLL
jgi:hypothetical protein